MLYTGLFVSVSRWHSRAQHSRRHTAHASRPPFPPFRTPLPTHTACHVFMDTQTYEKQHCLDVAPSRGVLLWLAVRSERRSCLLEGARGLLEVVVALLVGAAGTETRAEEDGPGAALEEEDREDDAEAEAEGGLDDEVGEAVVPLGSSGVSRRPMTFFPPHRCIIAAGWGCCAATERSRVVILTFSLRSDSLTGREMALGCCWRVTAESAMANVCVLRGFTSVRNGVVVDCGCSGVRLLTFGGAIGS